jgi:adenine-specific DNA methylase
MIPKECKRLAEVDFPIAAVSKNAAREKSIRHGHPSTLHVWWARRPLAACRAMLLGLLLPDPCDKLCPPEFKARARELLAKVGGQVGSKSQDLQDALLRFIGEFANWDLYADPLYLEVSRGLVKAAHPDEAPLVVDPFAGGGSIPLEALRLGCDAFASDLNPVACLILKVMLEDMPRHSAILAEELLTAGAGLKNVAEKELAPFYPLDADGARPVAYLWARTVRCETPSCGAEIPLVRSFWLSKQTNRQRALRTKVIRPRNATPTVEFDIFEPASETEVSGPSVSRAKATCVCCGTVLAAERVRTQLAAQRGGSDVVFDTNGKRTGGALLLAVITLAEGQGGRNYRLPTETDYAAVWNAARRLEQVAAQRPLGGLSPVPDEPLPLMSGTFNVPLYGIDQWGYLFTSRQALTLLTLARHIANLWSQPKHESTGVLAAFALNLFARSCNSGARLRPDGSVAPAFGMQALPITWTFPETVPWGRRAEHYEGSISTVIDVLRERNCQGRLTAQVQLADACRSPLLDKSCAVWFTDPPYYFAVPYADLSDFFLVWLKRALPAHPLLRDPFDSANPLAPKDAELCQMAHWDPVRYGHKDKAFFETGMRAAFAEGSRVLKDDGIGCVVFAHKTTEGWEALLSAMIQAGWTITSSWPIATEAPARLRARDSAALATSVHLVCRPRPQGAAVGDWADVLGELPGRVGNWIERLQREGVRGADLVFACIGPALEIFSRYSKVETAEGTEVKLDEYLPRVWEVVGRLALEQVLGTAAAKPRNGAGDALEEDARLTALFLWTYQSTATGAMNGDGEERGKTTSHSDDDEDEVPGSKARGCTLAFDVVRHFAQPLGIMFSDWEGRIIETRNGLVRLLPVAERAKQLFGEDGAQAVADRIEVTAKQATDIQLTLLGEDPPQVKPRKGRKARKKSAGDVPDESVLAWRAATTLDRVHAAMLLQTSGRTNALRAFLKAEQGRGPGFLRLANALSALYPTGSVEKRLLDAMLLAVPT